VSWQTGDKPTKVELIEVDCHLLAASGKMYLEQALVIQLLTTEPF
jgi:hypothetical protein